MSSALRAAGGKGYKAQVLHECTALEKLPNQADDVKVNNASIEQRTDAPSRCIIKAAPTEFELEFKSYIFGSTNFEITSNTYPRY